MSLFDAYTPATEPVSFRGGSFTVRGLSVNDLGLLVQTHLHSLETIALIVQAAQDGPAAGGMLSRIVLALAQDAPLLAGAIVSVAAGEGLDAAEAASRLPFPVVVDALLKIGRLTFEDVGGPENFVKALAALIASLRPATGVSAASPSPSSTEGSAPT